MYRAIAGKEGYYIRIESFQTSRLDSPMQFQRITIIPILRFYDFRLDEAVDVVGTVDAVEDVEGLGKNPWLVLGNGSLTSGNVVNVLDEPMMDLRM